MVGLFGLFPLAMAFLTLVLPDLIDRSANAILGVLAVVMWTWDLAEHVRNEPTISGGPIFTAAFILAGAPIVWHALKWPKPAERAVPRPATGVQPRASGGGDGPVAERRSAVERSTPLRILGSGGQPSVWRPSDSPMAAISWRAWSRSFSFGRSWSAIMPQ